MTKIAIISDSHDHTQTLAQVLQLAGDNGAEVLLHCGDLCAPFMLALLGERFAGPIHVVFGNNDGDGRLLQTIAARHSQIVLHGVYAELSIGGRQLAMIHYPEPARRIAQSGQFDLVCYGHDHIKHLEPAQRGWLVNPGELMGLKAKPTWALYDCETGAVKIDELV